MFQISQVGGVLESSGPPLEDGHRDFEDWCILGWGIHEKSEQILMTPSVWVAFVAAFSIPSNKSMNQTMTNKFSSSLTALP